MTEIRRHTTADIIVPSIHFNIHSPLTPEDIETGYVSWARVREICQKHHAEYVEYRRDIAAYMKAHGVLTTTRSGTMCTRTWPGASASGTA